jgi:hypothetical protein
MKCPNQYCYITYAFLFTIYTRPADKKAIRASKNPNTLQKVKGGILVIFNLLHFLVRLPFSNLIIRNFLLYGKLHKLGGI